MLPWLLGQGHASAAAAAARQGKQPHSELFSLSLAVNGIWSLGASIGSMQVNLDARRGDERNKLARYFQHHLDWYSRVVSPFISTYDDSNIAFREAERRRSLGKEGVTVTKIDVGGDLRWTIRYRNARLLAQELSVGMSDEAWAASEHEFIFANYIPHAAIVEVHSFD